MVSHSSAAKIGTHEMTLICDCTIIFGDLYICKIWFVLILQISQVAQLLK